MKNRFQALLACVLLLPGLLAGCGSRQTGNGAPGQSPAQTAPRQAAPVEFEALDLDGNTVTSAIFADSRLTMVNVWATYCGPCLREMPDLGELARQYDAADLQLVGVVSDVLQDADADTVAAAADLAAQAGADYPHLLLNESLYDALLTDVTAVPTTFFLDAEGCVVSIVVGANDKDAWEETIDALLAEG